MLVLSRQRDEIVMLGRDIEIIVVDIRGDKVRLGITAPKELSVHRKEVYEAIQRENEAAAKIANQNDKGLPPLKASQEQKAEGQPPAELVAMAKKFGYTLVRA